MLHRQAVPLVFAVLILFNIARAQPPPALVSLSGNFIESPSSLALQVAIDDNTVATAAEPWTMNCWIYLDRSAEDAAIIAGFGDGEDSHQFTIGRERFFCCTSRGLQFWGCGRDLQSDTKLDLNRWQMLTAAYDGSTLSLYKNAVLLGQQPIRFADAAAIAHLAPNPQSHLPRFIGKIAQFQIWHAHFSAQQVQDLLVDRDRIQAMDIPTSPGGHSWDKEKTGVIGKVAPQPADTLPTSATAVIMPSRKPKAKRLSPLMLTSGSDLLLNHNWEMAPAPSVSASIEQLSDPTFNSVSWYDATVPGTALTTLVDQGVYPDPYFGLNNTVIPDTLCRQDYWYRNQFQAAPTAAPIHTFLNFQGINYSAQIWLNGVRLGDMRGAFVRGSFDVSSVIKATNVLLVKVSPPPHPGTAFEKSLRGGVGCNGGALCQDGPTFISSEGWDWMPAIKDRNTGIWQDVVLHHTGPVSLGDSQVVTALPLPDNSQADLTIRSQLHNNTSTAQTGTLRAEMEDIQIEQTVRLLPEETQTVTLDPNLFKQLSIQHPGLWWPNGLGKPELHHLRMTFVASDSSISDECDIRFGIRQFTFTRQPQLTIAVNGRKLMIRGGDWGMDDAMKRVSRQRLEPFIRMHRDANLNLIRNWTGECDEEAFYDLCDEYGILVWNDFWMSSQNSNMQPAEPALFLHNARDVILRFRNHPCIAVLCGRNEGTPPAVINKPLADLISTLDGTRFYQPNSREGAVMRSGPWKYLNPTVYYSLKNPDRGFTTELGMPSVPTVDAMKAMMPTSDAWPLCDAWAYHDMHPAVNGGTYLQAINDNFGPATSLADFDRKAQMLNYSGHRAMYEGWNSNLFDPCSGIIIWMSHPAWPSTMWQLYSSDYEPNAALFAVKKACEPIHIQLNLASGEIDLVNNTDDRVANAKVTTRIYDLHSRLLTTQELIADAPACQSAKLPAIRWPVVQGPEVYFVSLELHDSGGRLLSDNFYWYAKNQKDLRHLNEVPVVALRSTARLVIKEKSQRIDITVENPTDHMALLAHLTLRDSHNGQRILPVYYSDNYLCLVPGQSRQVHIDSDSALKPELSLSIDGYNLTPQTVQCQ